MTEFKVDILGDTMKQKWLNAIDLYLIVVGSNINAVRANLDGDNGIARERLDSAMNVLHEFGEEMKRLVEGVCK